MTHHSQTVRRLQEEVPNWWRKFQHKTDDEKNRVQDHLKLYLRMWDPSSGYSIKVIKTNQDLIKTNQCSIGL